MHFTIAHEFDIPRDALELAVLSPDLFGKMKARLGSVKGVEQKEHRLDAGKLHRRWTFRANINVPNFAKKHVTADMLVWDEESTYAIGGHEATWEVFLKPEWQKHFSAKGNYLLVELDAGRSKRVIEGELDLRVPAVVRKVAEAFILSEVKKTFEVEAETLREMATLA